MRLDRIFRNIVSNRFLRSIVSNRLFRKLDFNRVALIASLATAIIAMVLYAQVDSMLAHDINTNAVQYSSTWYGPYSTYTQLIYAFLGIAAAVSAIALGYGIFMKPQKRIPETASVPAPAMISALNNANLQEIRPQEIEESNPPEPAQTEIHTEKTNPKQDSNGNICANCNKTFTRPLVTLNFINGKPTMVETCPYCGEPIQVDKKEEKTELDVEVAEREEQEAE
jgi:hypothetical protein